MSEDRIKNIEEVYQSSDTAWADDIRTLVKEIKRVQKDNKYLREARDRLMGDNIKSDTTIATLREALEKARIAHLVVDGDCWFSCPKSDECCDDRRDKNVCDCGADAHNERLDKALAPAHSVEGRTDETT